RRSHPNNHLDELGGAKAKEGDTRLAGDCTGEERLACTRCTNEQDALWHGAPKPLVLVGILEEVNDLDQLVLRFIDACDVCKGHLGLLFAVALGATAPEPEDPAATRRRSPPRKPHKRRDQEQGGTEPDHQLEPGRTILVEGVHHDALLIQQLLKTWVGEHRALCFEACGANRRSLFRGSRCLLLVRRRFRSWGIGHLVLESATDRIADARYLRHVARLDLLFEERVWDSDGRGLAKERLRHQIVDQQK